MHRARDVRKTAEMTVSLRPNLGIDTLAKLLTIPSAVIEVVLTNCILLDPNELTSHIRKCTNLRCLRCVACTFRPSDLLMLMLKDLPHLAVVEFSLVSEAGAVTELERMQEFESQKDINALVPIVRRMYVEVGGDHNFRLLSKLLSFCPILENLHVHFVRGTVSTVLSECHSILAERVHLERFTFTSELPVCYRQKPTTQSAFTSRAALCANVSHRKSANSWSCVRLRELADGSGEMRLLPIQLVVAIVDFEEGLTAERIRVATLRHNWACVRCLCLLLLPEKSSSVVYPMAGATYRDSLRYLLSTVLKCVTELNISSFHFGPDLDVVELFQEGSLKYLQSFSASPCGLRRPSALRFLAQNCPDLKDLDVRYERRGRFHRCTICDGEVLADADDATKSCSSASPVFPNGLARLTLTGLQRKTCFSFIGSCKQAVTMRLSDCSASSDANYVPFVQALADSTVLSCLVLQEEHLDFTDASLLDNLSRIGTLECLYLLSEVPLIDDVAVSAVYALSARLPRLLCLHVHYRTCDTSSTDSRITWMKRGMTPESCGVVVLNGPCFHSCSTATFVGLAKPLNRGLKPNL